MKTLFYLLVIFGLTGCLADKINELQENVDESGFIGKVPADFNWTTIDRHQIDVTIKSGGSITHELDNSLILLCNGENELLDALTILDGKAEFSVRIPAVTENLKLFVAATNEVKDINVNQTKVDFSVANLSAINLNKTDSDHDLLIDKFDADPNDPEVSVIIPVHTTGQLKSAMNMGYSSDTYIVFEDLWPSKGDFDFNDLVIKSTVYWVRGKENYISEISGKCKIEHIGAGMGLGFGYEILGVQGSNSTYIKDVITEISGTGTKDASVANGVIMFNKVQDIGKGELNFTLKIADKAIKDFALVPYLFRTDNYNQQIRPFGAPPTKSEDMKLFRTLDDASPFSWKWDTGRSFKYPLSGADAFYRTKENYPWAIEFIAKSFKPSPEKTSITEIYPQFKTWAESGGVKDKDWYNYPVQ